MLVRSARRRRPISKIICFTWRHPCVLPKKGMDLMRMVLAPPAPAGLPVRSKSATRVWMWMGHRTTARVGAAANTAGRGELTCEVRCNSILSALLLPLLLLLPCPLPTLTNYITPLLCLSLSPSFPALLPHTTPLFSFTKAPHRHRHAATEGSRNIKTHIGTTLVGPGMLGVQAAPVAPVAPAE